MVRWDRRDISGKGGRPSVNELVADFFSLVPRFSDVFMLLDGLDECQTLADLFDPLQRLANSPCRLFLSSREEPALRALPMLQCSIKLDIWGDMLNQTDLNRFLQRHQQQHPALMDTMSAESCQKLFDQLIRVSEGKYDA
jgi:hypothetical protein